MRLKAVQSKEKRLKEAKGHDKLLREIAAFLEMLKNHARLEVRELFPMIAANEKCMALLKQYAADVPSGQ